MLKQVAIDQAEADVVKEKVSAEEATLAKQSAEVKAVADDAQADLDVAMPALNNAVKALDSSRRRTSRRSRRSPSLHDLGVLRTPSTRLVRRCGWFLFRVWPFAAVASIASPSAQAPAVQITMEGVCVMLDEKPDWPTAKKVLGDSQFLPKPEDLRQGQHPGADDQKAAEVRLRRPVTPSS